MSEPTADLLPYTFATWAFMLHVAGERASDTAVAFACDAVLSATDEAHGNRAGEELVRAVRRHLAGDAPEQVTAAATGLYGSKVSSRLGQGERAERNSHIRQYQFGRQLPWLARIWERVDGQVRPSWLLIEQVTDDVRAADPNPWNDVDETRVLPVADFHVLWELDGCTAIHLA
jgi:hypothetical protein